MAASWYRRRRAPARTRRPSLTGGASVGSRLAERSQPARAARVCVLIHRARHGSRRSRSIKTRNGPHATSRSRSRRMDALTTGWPGSHCPRKESRTRTLPSRLKHGLSASARFLKTTVLSGYRSEHWGLGEIEAFGTGATMLPEDEPNHVTSMPPNCGPELPTIIAWWRRTAAGPPWDPIGPTQRRPIPGRWRRPGPRPGSRPRRSSSRGGSTRLGCSTQFWFEYGPDARYGSKTTPAYGGLQITPRSAYATVEGLSAGTTYHYRIVASNSTGTTQGADAVFTTAR